MKKNQITRNVFAAMGLWAIAAMTVTGCQKKGKDQDLLRLTTAGILTACTDTMSVPKNSNDVITTSILTKDKIWKLNGVTYVGPGQTLTIEPGTTIVTGSPKQYNDPTYGPHSVAGILVVARQGKLIADGKTKDSAIVFTTLRALGCQAGSCDISGAGPSIVMIGAATTNRTTYTRVEGIPQPAGADIYYGAGYSYNNADNSGILRYVRIEFPGYSLRDNNEINGLTLAGVGSGTTISHVQVSYSMDDAFQFFGGTVNCEYLVAIGTRDDDYDFEHGYTGTINYAIGLKDPGSTHSDCNGIEAENDGTGTTAAPLTKPVLRHFTLLGYATNSNLTDLLRGGRFRRTTALDIEYSIFGGFPTGAEFNSISNPSSTISNFSYNVLQAYTSSAVANPVYPIRYLGNYASASSSPANHYLQLGNAANPFLSCSSAGSYNVELLVPDLGSPADGTSSTYRGAFDPNVATPGIPATFWTYGWTNFNPNFCCIN